MVANPKAGPTPHEWMVDVLDAATELGYGVESLTPGSVRMSDRAHTITVETIFLSGDTLRALFRSRREPTPVASTTE
jgi:hypothetical protein